MPLLSESPGDIDVDVLQGLEPDEEPLQAARGLAYGCLLSLPAWGLLLWLLL